MHAEAKKALRAALLARRAALRTDEIEEARERVRAHVLSHFATVRRVAGYRPLRTEPGSVELLDALATAGAEVIVPLLRPDRDLDWTPWPNGEALGLEAIAAVDLVLVPALAVDRRGLRLGRGGGSYDRALCRVRPGAAIVALVYDDELVDNLVADAWDVSVTGAITPSGWHPRQ